jgi:hypothetical protein
MRLWGETVMATNAPPPPLVKQVVESCQSNPELHVCGYVNKEKNTVTATSMVKREP